LYLDSVCNEEQLHGYKTSVQALWDNNYARLDVGEPSVEVEVAAAVPTRVSKPSLVTWTELKWEYLQVNKGSLLSDHIKSYSKRPTRALRDEYTRYCLLDLAPEHPDSHLTWWCLHEAEFPRLARIARDIFSIPGMSTEVERLFSSVKHMLGPPRSILRPEGIEAAECVRSWVKARLILNNYFEYLSVGDRNTENFRLDDAKLAPFRSK
jgi:hypothetical protein